MSCPGVEYRQGTITSVALQADRRLEATFCDGGRHIVDRVLTRYGARGGVAIATAARRDDIAGDFLLRVPQYTAPDPRNPSVEKWWNPVRDELLRSLDALLPVNRSTRVDISKDHYVRHLTDGPEAVPSIVGLPADPQAMLSTELRNRRRPVFDADAFTTRFTL